MGLAAARAAGALDSPTSRSTHLAAQEAQAASPPVPSRSVERTGPQTGPLSGYMELHFNGPTNGEPGILDFHRFVLLFSHRFSDRLRFVGELELEHAVVEGLEEAGELELEQAYIDFLVHPAAQLPRRHAARARRHHQRAARAADVSRRRAPVRRHGHRADDLVRRRRRRARRVRPRLPLPRLRHGAARRHRVQRGRGTARRRAEGRRGAGQEHGRSPGGSSTSALRGLQTGVSFWRGDTSFNVPADRHDGRALRVRRALHARPFRDPRPVRARVHRRRGRAERRR